MTVLLLKIGNKATLLLDKNWKFWLDTRTKWSMFMCNMNDIYGSKPMDYETEKEQTDIIS